jgi:hypothetical protein
MIQVQDCVSEFVNFNVGVREANSKGLAIQWKLQWSPYNLCEGFMMIKFQGDHSSLEVKSPETK